MKKIWLISAATLGVIVLAVVVSSSWFLSLPFIPQNIRNHFLINANIFPASDDSRSQFLAINPGFRAEFGDKDNPTNAFLRFEVTQASDSAQANGDVNRNLLENWTNVYEAFKEYQPGVEWQLFLTGVDESEMSQTAIGEDEEILRLMKELSGDQVISETPTEMAQVLSDKENIVTQTQVSRQDGYDLVENLAVAPDVDLTYTIKPGKGVENTIVLGDRKDFDTACLQLLSLGLAGQDCDLPDNKFSFLLKLDAGQKLIYSPLAIDDGKGTYYVQREDQPLLRLANPALVDAQGAKSTAVKFEIQPAAVDGVETQDYYIATITANLSWLLEKDRQYPVKISSGLFVDKLNFFAGEQLN
ncbi:MAG: hypothetical protein Q4G02_02380 [bacterium]|nr:hypothetical protein [bacterium]